MFISTEHTPNPNTIKFLPGREVVGVGMFEFVRGSNNTEDSPLSARLFEIEGVERVFLGNDFVSVSKSADIDWDDLQPRVLAGLMEHYLSGEEAVIEKQGSDGEQNINHEDREVVMKIKDLLETRVRPAVSLDGGDIMFKGFDKGIVYVVLRGACAGCPSATATLKIGIENMLRHYIPEVVEVRAVS